MNTALTTANPAAPPVGGVILTSAAAAKPPAASTAAPKTEDGFGFSDILAIVNPLQHIPVVGTLYREWTGDTISPAARIAGDTLYGGVFGLAASVADSLVEGTTGKDIGSHIYDTIFGESTPANPSTPATSTATTSVTMSAGVPVGTFPPGNNGPSSFVNGLQHGSTHKHAVPLATSMPLPESHPGPQAGTSATQAQAETVNTALANAAQQANNAASLPDASNTAPLPTLPGTTNGAASALPAPSNPLVGAPTAGISNLMLQALDKYKAMAQQQGMQGAGFSLTN